MADILIFQEDHGKSFDVKLGNTIDVRLVDNPTTGYRWKAAETSDQIITLLKKDFKTATDAGIGAGGIRTFTFKTNSPGIVILKFILGREWEPEESAIDQFEVTIYVQE